MIEKPSHKQCIQLLIKELNSLKINKQTNNVHQHHTGMQMQLLTHVKKITTSHLLPCYLNINTSKHLSVYVYCWELNLYINRHLSANGNIRIFYFPSHCLYSSADLQEWTDEGNYSTKWPFIYHRLLFITRVVKTAHFFNWLTVTKKTG